MFVRPLEDVTLNDLHLKGVFECEISKAGLKVEWQKKGKPLKADDKYSIESEGAVYRLIINDAIAEDEANYTIVVKDVNSSAKLTIHG